MPNIKSAEKRMRQNVERRLQNRGRRSKMRSHIKKFRQLIEEEKMDEAREFLPELYRVIDRTAQKGSIHPNAAARHKSRLSRKLS